jgi:hypothetical protein
MESRPRRWVAQVGGEAGFEVEAVSEGEIEGGVNGAAGGA